LEKGYPRSHFRGGEEKDIFDLPEAKIDRDKRESDSVASGKGEYEEKSIMCGAGLLMRVRKKRSLSPEKKMSSRQVGDFNATYRNLRRVGGTKAYLWGRGGRLSRHAARIGGHP